MASNKKPTSSIPSYSDGDWVELHGLEKSPRLNGRVGIVAGGMKDGRYPVSLYELHKEQRPTASDQMAIKPENLKVCGKMAECNGCFNIFSQLTVCGKCYLASYCSQDCQLQHWPEHKKECKSLAQARKSKHGKDELPSDYMDRIKLRLSRARHWMEKGKHAKAETEYRAVIQEPNFEYCQNKSDMYSMLTDSLIVQQDEAPEKISQGIAVLREFVALPNLSPEDQKHLPDHYARLGDALYAICDLDGAEVAYKSALDLGGGIIATAPEIRRAMQRNKQAKKDLAKFEKKKSSKGKKGRGSASK